MDCLVKSSFVGTITWLGHVPNDAKGIRSIGTTSVITDMNGIVGEAHSGGTRSSCVRVAMLYPKGTEIRNTRQLSILSTEENAEIAAQIGLETLNPEWLGASVVIAGIPDFSHVPPGSRLQTAAGTTLAIDLENGPCNFPAKEIEADHPGHGKSFKVAAMGRRGVTGWVERPGPLTVGDTVSLYVPTQPSWSP